MVEYIIKFQMLVDQRIVDNKTVRVDKKKYENIKAHTKNQLKGVSKKQNPKYNKNKMKPVIDIQRGGIQQNYGKMKND